MFRTATSLGPVGRLGCWTATHFKAVAAVWALIAVGLGLFAPRVEHALSGAGWEASGSESVEVRKTVDRDFGGLSSSALMVVVHSEKRTATAPAFKAVVADARGALAADARVTEVTAPQPGQSISRDGHTAVIRAGAGASSNEMVRAADDLKGQLRELERAGVQVSLTGASGMWSDFNEANKSAMMKSELISWPVTMAILLLAFGSLVAAGLPLMLTILSLVASAGSLYLGTQVLDISIWAMNFALMFALALGIDYALFIVYRFRGALFGSHKPVEVAVGETMDTAGKAVLFSGVTVLISLSAVMLVPSPAFRSMAAGIMVSVLFILAAALTLLPAVLARLGARVDKLALPWVHSGEHRSARLAAWAERLWRRPVAYGVVALVALVALSVPVLGLQTGMPSIKVVPEDDGSRVAYTQVQEAFGTGAPGALQIVAPKPDAPQATAIAKADPGVAQVMPAMSGRGGDALVEVVPKHDPSDKAVGGTIDRLRAELPAAALVGGAVAENHDLETALTRKAPLVIGVVLALGFLLLLVALQAPVLAAIGVITNLLALGAAFGVARLIFQEGHLANLLGLEPQGFLNAWAPVFFFAMVFAISMDYTV
ncbi:MAG TPA: MMPL family transporter, partial [Thermoleophilaceae bacterium]